MAELRLKEIKTIELTVEHGYDGEELDSAKFKKNGCLDGERDKVTGEFKNRSMIKFIRKLETIYESVRVEGKGKNREYILNGKRDEVLEMEDKRKNNGITDDDAIMSKFFFNRLTYMNADKPKTLYQWAVDVGAYNPKLVKIERIERIFGDMYYGEDNYFIYNQFITYMKNRNRAVSDMCIKLLKRDGRIDTMEYKMGLDENDEVVVITENEYKYYASRKNEILGRYELTAFNYEHHLKKNDLLKNDIEKLIKETGYQSVWIAYKIELISTEQFENVDYNSFQEAYWNKTALLIDNLKTDESKLYSFANVYKKFNLATIIKSVGFKNEAIDSIAKKYQPTQVDIDSTMHIRKDKHYKMPDSWTIEQVNKIRESQSSIKIEQIHNDATDKSVKSMTIDDIVDFDSIVLNEYDGSSMDSLIDIEDTNRFIAYDTSVYDNEVK